MGHFLFLKIKTQKFKTKHYLKAPVVAADPAVTEIPVGESRNLSGWPLSVSDSTPTAFRRPEYSRQFNTV